MYQDFNGVSDVNPTTETNMMFTELSPEEADSINGGGRRWNNFKRKFKRFFQRIWYGDPEPMGPGNQNDPDPDAPIHPPIHF